MAFETKCEGLERLIPLFIPVSKSEKAVVRANGEKLQVEGLLSAISGGSDLQVIFSIKPIPGYLKANVEKTLVNDYGIPPGQITYADC